MILHILTMLAFGLFAEVVGAQDAPAPAKTSVLSSEARLHFDRGVELYREGSYDAALAEFQRADQVDPNYRILFNLAQVQAERHEYVAAVKLLTEYMQRGGSEISTERKQQVEQDLEKLRQRIAALTIEVNVEGAEVFIDDEAVGRSPLREPVLVNVGTCRVRAEKQGYLTRAQTLTIAGADTPRVALSLVAAPNTLTQPAQTRVLKTSNMTPFWIALGATVAFGGTTGVFGTLALGADHDLDRALDRFPTDQKSVDSTRSKLRTMAALTDGFGAATIVAAGAAVYFLIAPPEHTETVPSGGVHARIAPTPNGMALAGTF